jgi:LCP family protein required for cell wall assembly
MKRRKIDFLRLLAAMVVVGTVAYFYLNLFSPGMIPKTFRIGIPRRPINLLILGTDITFDAVTGKPMPSLEGRADTILLAHIDPVRFRINLLSIPRDTYVNVPKYGMMKINAANAYGGVPLLRQTVSDLTHQNINYYLEVKPTAITRLVDLIGGVTLYVEKDMYYIDRAQRLDINLKKGWQKLSGKQAHDYIRYRNDIQGDIGRISRQQTFLKALSESLTRPTNILKAPFAIRSALQEIKTDLPLPLAFRLMNFSRMLSPADVRTVLASGEVSYVEQAGSVWVLNPEGFEKELRELF